MHKLIDSLSLFDLSIHFTFLFHSGNTSNGTHHRVLPPALGGNGTIPGGAHTTAVRAAVEESGHQDNNFSSTEWADFRGLSQTVASLTWENLAEREAEVGNLPLDADRDNAMAKCKLGLRAWRAKRPMHCLHGIMNEDGHPLENEDESGGRLCDFGCTTFQARAEGARQHQYENILQYVQKAPDDIRWVIDQNEVDELMAAQKEFAPGPDGIPYSFCRCAGGLGSRILFCANKHVLEGGTVPELFA